MEDKSTQKRIKEEIFDWIKTIVIAIAVAYFITNVIIINAEVPTNSMENTIMIGDRLVANRLSYTFNEPKRGDVIVFPFPDDEEKLYVKRIVGLSNELVEIKEGVVYINGVMLEEDYVSSDIVGDTRNSTYLVPEGHLFMMGDNRKDSIDSRFWNNKFLDIEKIDGKVCFRYFPFPKFIK